MAGRGLLGALRAVASSYRLSSGSGGITAARAFASAAGGLPTVHPTEASSLIKDNSYTLVDVRTPEEYAAGSVPGSINVPVQLSDGSPNAALVDQVKAQAGTAAGLVCTCAFGRRGGVATQQLAAAGLEQVLNLEGGLAQWSASKLPFSGEIKKH